MFKVLFLILFFSSMAVTLSLSIWFFLVALDRSDFALIAIALVLTSCCIGAIIYAIRELKKRSGIKNAPELLPDR